MFTLQGPLAFLIAALTIRGDGSRRSRWIWPVAVLFGLGFVARIAAITQHTSWWPWDFHLFYKAGVCIWAQEDP